jgi:Holliday junction resolvasome RuvABC endonuclease subunit
MILTLDLSLKSTGFAKFSKDGKLMEKGRIIPDSKIDNCTKIHYIINQINFAGIDEVIIEDVYYGKNFRSVMWLSRLSGGAIYAWVGYKYKIPKFYNASKARSLAGINGHSHKAEVQVFVLNKYNFAPKTKIKQYKKSIDKLNEDYKSKKIKRGSYKYKMNKISDKIDKDTGIGEDIADAIILGLAYQKDKK